MALTVAQLVARLTADTSGFYKSMAIANSTLIRTGSITGRVFAGMGLAATGFGILSLKMAGDYQSSMNVLEAVTGATGKQMNKMGDEAIALGRDMKLPNVSAKDAADAMTALGKGGLSVNQILGATRGVLQLGIASNTGFADSAVIVARALKAFGLQGTQATHVADLFTSAANASTSEMGDIALGFQAASAQFRRGQQSIEDLTTSLTLMNDAGVIGSDAGTSLKTMMNRLISPTKKAHDVMEKFGISVYDSAGNVKPMPELVSLFSRQLKGLSNEQRNAALYTIFGSDAIRAANIVLMHGRKNWDEYSKKVNKHGAAQKMAEARTKGFNGALQALQSQIETIAIEVGQKMLPGAEAAVRAITAWIATLDKADGPLKGIKSAVSGFINYMVENWPKIAPFVTALKGIWESTFKSIKQIIQDLYPVIKALGPLFIAVLGVAGATILAFSKMVQVQFRVLAFAIHTIQPVLMALASWVGTAAAAVVRVIKFLAFNWRSVTGEIGTLAKKVGTFFTTMAKAVTAAVSAIVSFLRSHWTLIITIVLGPLGLLVVQVVRFWGLIRKATETAWDAVKAIVSGVMHVLTPIVSGAARVIRGAIVAAWNGILAVTRAIWGRIGPAVRAALSHVSSAIAGAARATYGAAVALGRGIVTGILDGLSGLGAQVAAKIKDAATGAIHSVMGHLGIHSPSTVTRDKIGKPLGQGIVEGFLLGTRDLPDKVNQRIQRVLEGARNKVSALQDKFRTWFDRIRDTALSAFDAITEQHQTPTEKLIASIDDARTKQQLAKAVTKAQSDLTKAIADGADPQEIADLQQALNDAQYEQWKYGAEKQADAERKDYNAQRALQRQHLEDQLNDLEEYLMKHPGKWKNAQEMIVNLLNSYGLTYKNIGKALGDAYVDGMKESLGNLVKTLRTIAGIIAKYLKIKSPAERGPLSDLNHWWDGFADTLVAGLDKGPIERASRSLAGATTAAYSTRPGMGATASGFTVNIPLYNPVFLGQDRDTARKLADTVRPHLNRTISIGS